MFRIFTLVSVFCFAVMAWSQAARADGEPSAGAAAMPGAKGTFAYTPDDWSQGETTWWKDTDGVDPGTAGCHVATDNKGNPNGRSFGEACLASGLLVESNPGAGILHKHADDTGHPDTFDCNAWCVGTGASTGTCTVAQAPPCGQSAMCVCN